MIPSLISDQIADIYNRLAEIERRSRNRKRTGTIAARDLEKGLYRVKISEKDAKPFLTPWMKARTLAAGGVKIDIILSEGEQVDVTSENGDLTDAVIDLSTYSDANRRENSDTPLHIKIGNTVIAASGDGVTITAGGGHLA